MNIHVVLEIHATLLDERGRYRIDERTTAHHIYDAAGRHVRLNLGAAAFPLVDPALIRDALSGAASVQLVGSNAAVLDRVAQQLNHLRSAA
jgi:hypothetical protein